MRQVYFRVSMSIVVLFALRVEAVPDKVPAIVSLNHVTFQAGNASSFTVTTTGTPAPSITATGVLPSGITFVDGRGSNKGTGLLSGSPVRGSAGRYPITFTATNPHGSSSQSFALVVCDAIQIANPSATTATAGVPFSANFTQTGGAGTTSFSIASGSLPAGLSLSADGTVSGTPAGPGNSTIVVQATDTNGCSGVSATWTLIVTSAPPVATADAYETPDGAPMTIAAPGLFANDSLHGATLIGYGVNGNEQTTAGASTLTQAGGSVAVALDGSFVYAPPAVSNIVQDVFRYTVANSSGSAIGTVTVSVYPHACGTQPISVTITSARPAGMKDFDPYALSAAAASLDDDSSICPARFSHAPYSFSWSVSGPSAFSLSSNSGASTTLMVGATGSWTVTATAASQNSGDTATGSQTASIVTTCNPVPVVGAITIAGGASTPHGLFSDFNRDDVITLAAQTNFAACYSSPFTAVPTFKWSLSGAVLQNPNSTSPSFVVDSPFKTYLAAVIVTDRWGNASAPVAQSLSSSSCGANPATVVAIATAPAFPMDPWSVQASVTSADDNATLCPARFANSSYAVTFSTTPSDGTTLSSSGFAATLKPGTPTQHTVTVTAQGSSGDPAGSTGLVIDSSCAPPDVPAPTISPVGTINAGDTVTLSAPATSHCFSAPSMQYAWTVSSAGGPVVVTANGSTASFVLQGFNTTYTASVTVTDAGQATTSPSTTFTTSSCGSTPPTIIAPSVTQTIPSVNFTIAGQAPQTGDLTIRMDVTTSGPPSTTIGTETYVLPFYLGFPVVSNLLFGTSDCTSFSFVSASVAGPASWVPQVSVPSARTVFNGDVFPFTFTPTVGDLNNIPALYEWLVNVLYGGTIATIAVAPVGVGGVCGGNAPIATFGSSVVAGGSGTAGQAIQLDASQSSDADNTQLVLANGIGSGCGLNQALTYAWSIASAPAGSAATVSPALGALSSFVPDVAGTYTIALVVTDSTGRSSAQSQDIVVASAPSPK